jgi:hypothetical protein
MIKPRVWAQLSPTVKKWCSSFHKVRTQLRELDPITWLILMQRIKSFKLYLIKLTTITKIVTWRKSHLTRILLSQTLKTLSSLLIRLRCWARPVISMQNLDTWYHQLYVRTHKNWKMCSKTRWWKSSVKSKNAMKCSTDSWSSSDFQLLFTLCTVVGKSQLTFGRKLKHSRRKVVRPSLIQS